MGKSVYIAEKPSVAQAFAKALKEDMKRRDGYLESDSSYVTWCVGHLITMSYPDAYDPALKRWSLETLPFIPEEFKYEVIPQSAKQFKIVSALLNRRDVDCIYVCTDSGREGEYIYRLVEQEAHVHGKERRRVWIDSQTEEEILRGIREAKDLSAYDSLSDAAYLRAKEDYLMGINFSRLLTVKYGNKVSNYLHTKPGAISVGRVMTCVQGMVVRRERQIREFVKTPFYRVVSVMELPVSASASGKYFCTAAETGTTEDMSAVAGTAASDTAAGTAAGTVADTAGRKLAAAGMVVPETGAAAGTTASTAAPGSAAGTAAGAATAGMAAGAVSTAAAEKAAPVKIEGEWRAVPGSKYEGTPALYKENGFKEREEAKKFCKFLQADPPVTCRVRSIERKPERKNPPLLYNLAELQNDGSRRLKMSPDETLAVTQELYEKKLVTYPRTDARVLSTAVAKEINRNIRGLISYEPAASFAEEILNGGRYKNLAKTRYVNDKQITDHYAIVPTGQGFGALRSLSGRALQLYDMIVRRFLSIFYPPAVYQKVNLVTERKGEAFFSAFRMLKDPGYYVVAGMPGRRKEDQPAGKAEKDGTFRLNPAENAGTAGVNTAGKDGAADPADAEILDSRLFACLQNLKKGDEIRVRSYDIREGETAPPKRYTSGSLILAMENAGQLIEDEELRAQIKGCGIGTSATRAEILKKLVTIRYLQLNKKSQIVTPTLLGEMVYDVVDHSIRSMLNPELTASWEKGLSYVAEQSITPEEYMEKLTGFIERRTQAVKETNNSYLLLTCFDRAAKYYKAPKASHRKAAAAKTSQA